MDNYPIFEGVLNSKRAYLLYKEAIYHSYERMKKPLDMVGISAGKIVSAVMWEGFAAYLTGDHGTGKGRGSDLQDHEIKSQQSRGNSEYQYCPRTGIEKWEKDRLVNHVWINYSPNYRDVEVRYASAVQVQPIIDEWLPEIEDMHQRYLRHDPHKREVRKWINYTTMRELGSLVMLIKDTQLIHPSEYVE